jgi:glycosyltransferase involved in cell wall biosynthesis
MPFIEAMAMGKVVVATNHPTMNEYIVNGVNGILFNINDLKPVNFLDSKNIANNARKFAFNSYNNWEKTKMDLVSWILTDQK